LYLQNFDSKEILLKIYDAKGRMMLKEKLSVNGSLFKEIDAQRFARGIYFIRVETGEGKAVTKRVLKK
jgi:hypothetical protein